MNAAQTRGARPGAVRRGAPLWLILLTAALTLTLLFMAVAETTLWTHFLVDRGESLSLVGLGFILMTGLALHRRRRLLPSLPLLLPWLVYPVVTQADQIIDNLTINQMRLFAHAVLALIFGTPIAVLALAARQFLAPAPGAPPRRRTWTPILPGLRLIEQGRVGEGMSLLVIALLFLELWVAFEFLGRLMILALVAMGFLLLYYISAVESRPAGARAADPAAMDRRALWALVAGVLVSFGLFVGYKHRPGAYQGSPHYYHDPSQKDAAYNVALIAVPDGPYGAPAREIAVAVRTILEDHATVLRGLFDAYFILDRNYNYAFHNALFMRSTPLMADFRAHALAGIGSVRTVAADAEARLTAVRPRLPADGGLAAFLGEAEAYVAFNLRRASQLEELSGRFEQTPAGLQHATHLYEGENKVLGEGLLAILDKHRALVATPAMAGLARPFVETSRQIQQAYANRIVGF